MAGHHEVDDPVRAPGFGGLLRREAEQPRFAVGQGAKRLGDDGRLGAAAADPALDGSVRMDDPARAGLRRRRARNRDDGREGVRTAGLSEGGRPGQDPRGRGGHQAVSPFSLRIAQTFWGVIGMSMWRTPACQSASTTAFANAGGAPTVADSPTPFAPIG